jgi:hypothetical protein
MPQPISGVLPNREFSIVRGGTGEGFALLPDCINIGNVMDLTMRRHPHLAILVSESIASWTNVESFMLQLFVELMGGHADKAATVFLALETQSAKTQAINAIIPSLPEEQSNVLRAILAIAKTNQKSRDKLAHWIWGYCTSLPTALLLLNPKVAVRDDLDLSDVYVYFERDFVDIIQANNRRGGHPVQRVVDEALGNGLDRVGAREQIAERIDGESEILDHARLLYFYCMKRL